MGFSLFSHTNLLISIFIISSILQLESSTSPISPPTIQLPQSTFTFSVTDYGAAGDGVQYDTPHIQAAIDDCSAHGGGRVTFPPGTYLTATIFLKSGVVLEVQENATILGGTKLEDYPAENSRWYVVVAEDTVDVGITGGGEINGQGLKFVERFDEKKNVMVSWNKTGACLDDECRPRLVGFLRCKNARLWNIKLTEPAYWCTSFNTGLHHLLHTQLFVVPITPTNPIIEFHFLSKTFPHYIPPRSTSETPSGTLRLRVNSQIQWRTIHLQLVTLNSELTRVGMVPKPYESVVRV